MRSAILLTVATVALLLTSCRGAGDSSPAPVELQAGGLTWVVDDGKWQREGDALVGTAGNVWTREDLQTVRFSNIKLTKP